MTPKNPQTYREFNDHKKEHLARTTDVKSPFIFLTSPLKTAAKKKEEKKIKMYPQFVFLDECNILCRFLARTSSASVAKGLLVWRV